MQDPAQPIASRAFGITVGMRMVELYPELAPEFKLLLEDALRMDPGPGVRSRATKALRALERQEQHRSNDPGMTVLDQRTRNRKSHSP